MSLLTVTSGKLSVGNKLIVYGPEGSGKSTLVSKFPSPVYIDLDGGTAKMSVNRLGTPQTWHELLNLLQEIVNISGQIPLVDGQMAKTLVIDGASKADELCRNYVCANANKADITKFGYGDGYNIQCDEFNKLINFLDYIMTHLKLNVCIVGHSRVRTFSCPETEAYDRYELDLTESKKQSISNNLKRWADTMLFCNFKTHAMKSEGEKSAKGHGGQRVVYTSHMPAFDAKNRDELEHEIDNATLNSDAVTKMINKIFNIATF